MNPASALAKSALLAAIAAPALAQSINVDWGDAASAPSPTYAAAGRAGAWNTLNTMPTGQRFPLVGRNGQPINATVYNIGGTSMLFANNPAITGDDGKLMNDMFLSFNNPTDLCIFFEHLANGQYEVITYALTPDNPMLLSRVRVDNANEGPAMIGGGWPGFHAPGITYARHTVTVTNGTLYAHSGLASSLTQSGMNGMQLLFLGPCPGDANNDAGVTFADLNIVLSNFGQAGAGVPGDVNNDGVVNFADLNIVLSNFGNLC